MNNKKELIDKYCEAKERRVEIDIEILKIKLAILRAKE